MRQRRDDITRPAGVREDSYVSGGWFFKRAWGWTTVPRVVGFGGAVIGDRTMRLFLHRPDLDADDVTTVRRYLAWKYGYGRLFGWFLVAAGVLVALANLPVAALQLPWSLVVAALAVALVDVAVVRYLRSRAATGLAATRSASGEVTTGRHRRFKGDLPPLVTPEEVVVVGDLLDQISALHQDRLLDTHEWDAARWWVWDVLGTSPRSRVAVGWKPLIERLDGLREQAARRAA